MSKILICNVINLFMTCSASAQKGLDEKIDRGVVAQLGIDKK